MIRVNPRLSNIRKIWGEENFIWWDFKPAQSSFKNLPLSIVSLVVKMGKGWVGKFRIWIKILRVIRIIARP